MHDEANVNFHCCIVLLCANPNSRLQTVQQQIDAHVTEIEAQMEEQQRIRKKKVRRI